MGVRTIVESPLASTMPKEPRIDRLRAGDEAAWDALVDCYHAPLRHLVCHFLNGWCEDVPDLVQEILLKAYRSIDTFREDCSLRSWLYRIALNTCRDYQKSGWKQRVALPGDLPETGEGHPDHAAAVVTRLGLDEAMAALPEEERLCLELRYYHDLSGREIAWALGRKESGVWTQVYAGLKRLRRLLGDEEAQAR